MKKDDSKNTSNLFIEEGDKKVWRKFKEDIPEGSFKPWQLTKKIAKLPLHFIFDGLKINRSLSRFKAFKNIGFFQTPINKLYNVVFHRKTKLARQEKVLIKNSIEEMDQDLRIITIKKAQGMAIFFMLTLIAVLLVPTLFFQVSSVIVYVNIGLSCCLLFLLIIGRLKDAYLLKHTEFNKADIFYKRFWNLSTQLSKVTI